MLTVVVGRAVFGSKITIGEAWERVRGRLLALLGLGALEVLAAVVLAGAVVAAIAGIAVAANTAAAVIVGIPLVLALIAVLAYLFTALTFAPVADRVGTHARVGVDQSVICLGAQPLLAGAGHPAAGRASSPRSSPARCRFRSASPASFWCSTPAQRGRSSSRRPSRRVGSAIGQIITAPFTAGVVVLLYTDIRIRAEAFDLVLQTGAAAGPRRAPRRTTCG